MSGLSSSGFEAKRTPQLKIELEQLLLDYFGSVNLNASAVFGQLVGLTVEQQADFWNRLEEVYWSQYPATAAGVNLDRVVALNGLTRLPAAPTAVLAVVSGAGGTLLSAGRIASNSQTGETYALTDSVTISATRSVGAQLNITTVVDSTNYWIALDGVTYTYNSGVSATKLSILNGLAAALPGWVTALVTGSGTEARLDIAYDTPRALTVSARITGPVLSVYANFAATRNGPQELPAGALSTITTPISGWTAVTNRGPGTVGRVEETDDELRSRRSESLRLGGSNTVDAIVTRLRQLPGVLTQRIAVNNTDTTNAEGIPSHSIRAIVDGGSDKDIAEVLFRYVAAGIGYYGSNTVNVVSEVTGTEFPVKFDRPTNVPFYVTVTIDDSVNTPVDAVSAAREALTAYADGFSIGEPVLYTRLFSPINAIIGDGAYVTTMKIGLTASPTGTSNLVPDPDERFVLPASNIQVFTV